MEGRPGEKGSEERLLILKLKKAELMKEPVPETGAGALFFFENGRDQTMKKMIDNIRKYLPAVLLLVLLLFCIRYREDLSVEKISALYAEGTC